MTWCHSMSSSPPDVANERSPSCSSCRVVPKRGQHYFVCKSCKRATYCSQACQENDWELHRPLCLDTVHNVARIRAISSVPHTSAASNAPSAETRLQLLETFLDAHARIVQQITPVATRHTGEHESFDHSKDYVVIQLAYRDDCGGNPSQAYRVESAEFWPEPVACERYPHLRGRIGRWDALKGDDLRARRGFLGFVHVLWVTRGDDFVVWQALPDYEMSSLQANALHQADGSDWLAPLRWAADNGFVYRHPRPGFPFPMMGYLKKKGAGWQWQPFSHAQLVAMGSDGVALL